MAKTSNRQKKAPGKTSSGRGKGSARGAAAGEAAARTSSAPLIEPAQQPTQAAPDAPAAAAPAQAAAASPSLLAPLAIAVFRNFWLGTVLFYIGTWAADMTSNIAMADATPSRILVALVSAAGSLPFFLLAVPAGVMPLMISQRIVLLVALAAMGLTGAAMAMVLATFGGAGISPYLILGYVFMLGVGNAFFDPIWRAVLPQVVTPNVIVQAYALDGVALNAARAAAPIIAAIALQYVGLALTYGLFAVSCGVMFLLIYRWTPTVTPTATVSRTTMGHAMRTGLQFVRFSANIRRVLLRVILFVLPYSAMWASMPIVGRQIMQLSSFQYGAMVGFSGIGALLAAALIERLRQMLSTESILLLGAILLSSNILAMALVQTFTVMCGTMLLAGAGWLLIMTRFQATLASALPLWVRGRVIAIFSLTFFGSVTLGSTVWGAVEQYLLTVETALVVAALLGLAFAVLGYRLPLPPATAPTVAAKPPFDLYAQLPADAGSGPVVISFDYRVPTDARKAFLAQATRVGQNRCRVGAYQWGIYVDAAKPEIIKEEFVVSSKEEYQAMQERMTRDDLAAFTTLVSMTQGATEPSQRQFIVQDLM